ncbi:MAG: alpha/beta hydrolase [Pseudomonadota bacterium]|nr:alpha/beta hydrolase [Pseudomonadota bacterium]
MKTQEIRPELRKAISRVPRLPFHRPTLLPISRLLFNTVTKTKAEAGVRVWEERDNGVRMRVIAPEQGATQGRALLWLHGGGHIAGRPNQLDDVASVFAKKLGAVVIAPYYRLAPKHPFPADLDDCFAAWQWLLVNAKTLGVNPERIAVVGNSAGGGLAASLVQRIADIGATQPAAQVLFYPMLDDRTAVDESETPKNHFIWNNLANHRAWSVYLAPYRPGDRELPAYAAAGRRTDLSGLPPAWLGVGGIDLFCAEGRAYAQNLKLSGVPCELHFVEGAPHVFEVMVPDVEVSKNFLCSACEFLETELPRNS